MSYTSNLSSYLALILSDLSELSDLIDLSYPAIYLSIYLSCLFIYFSIWRSELPVQRSTQLSIPTIYLSYLSFYLFLYLIYLSYLSFYLFLYLIYLCDLGTYRSALSI